jgi:Ca2+-binding RTX toxin-like protein
MRMQIEGVIRTGNPVLDRGITDLVVHQGEDGLVVYATSGRNGGLVGYRIDDEGTVTVHTTVEFPPHLTGMVSDRLILDVSGNTPRLFTGVDGSGLIGYGLRGDLTLGGRLTLTWDQARAATRDDANPHTLEALITMTGRAADLLPPGSFSEQIVDLRCITVEGRQIVVLADAESHVVRTFLRDPETGSLIPTDQYGAAQGLGIQAPTGMELTSVGGVVYAVLVSAGTSSVTVMRIEADGRLIPTDHVIDTGSTRFAGAQAVTTVQAGDHTFVVVGGADHGVTLFLLLPGGRLLYLDTVADTADLSLYNVSTITAVVDGDMIRIFVGSQRDDGITQLTIPIGDLGVQRTGVVGQATRITGTEGNDILMALSNNDTLRGGAGDDVLVSGPGRTIMEGGAGSDAFVIRADSTRVDIADFQRGQDWLDLSDLPMLRSLAQLTFATTANGARITYRGTTINITSQDGQPLTIDDLFPDGMIGPDRIPVLERVNPTVPGVEIIGTGGNDTLVGGRGNDTIWGGHGNDLIELTGGNDLVFAGPGNDTIIGSSDDTVIYGGAGDDLIYAIGGDNQIGGGPGNDTIYGGSGNDTLWGAEGDDLIHTGPGRNEAWGGDGNDTIIGGDGGNMLGGGRGNDLIRGGLGNDTIWGFDGDDVIHGVGGRNEIWAGRGNDTIHGGNGGDILGGGPGNDLIIGGAGNDTIFAGDGNDTLFGGGGADRFIFYRQQGINRIEDFNPDEGDVLVLFRGLWLGSGNLTAAELVALFGSINTQGDLVLDFSQIGGTVVVLAGFDDFEALIPAIEIG